MRIILNLIDMISERLSRYAKFFKLQRRDLERKYEMYANTSLSSLFTDGRAFYGTVDGISEQGHLILNFETQFTPRLKVPMVLCVLKQQSYSDYGAEISKWNCSSIKFRENLNAHTSFSDTLPIYFLNNKKTIGCGQVRYELVDAIKSALEQHKVLKFVMLETLPPTELLKNLTDYITLHPDDPNLDLRPYRTYDQWQPQELTKEDDIASQVLKSLEVDDRCILQGPPGTGKSFTLGEIINRITLEGKKVCVTTQSNASLTSLVSQDTIKPVIERGGKIFKTVLTAEELKKHSFLLPAEKGLTIPDGALLCSTYYTLSRIINEVKEPIYDLIVIEEASQAFMTAISAFSRLGKKCLIVGDPMQLPPVVEINNDSEYRDIDVETQANGMMTYVRALDIPSFRITTSYRLTAKSASQTKYFYGGNLTSVKEKMLDFEPPFELIKFFPKAGGTILYQTSGCLGANYSNEALELIRKIVEFFCKCHPKKRLAILSPFVLATKKLQEEFFNESRQIDILIETINRIQGETVDYTIYYIPARNNNFAYSENLFNVATSRSRSTTLIISDMPFEFTKIYSNKVLKFISECDFVK